MSSPVAAVSLLSALASPAASGDVVLLAKLPQDRGRGAGGSGNIVASRFLLSNVAPITTSDNVKSSCTMPRRFS